MRSNGRAEKGETRKRKGKASTRIEGHRKVKGGKTMKQYIKHAGDNDWKCIRCGCEFTLYLKGQYYLVPNHCPNCGSPSVSGESTPFTEFDDDEE